MIVLGGTNAIPALRAASSSGATLDALPLHPITLAMAAPVAGVDSLCWGGYFGGARYRRAPRYTRLISLAACGSTFIWFCGETAMIAPVVALLYPA